MRWFAIDGTRPRLMDGELAHLRIAEIDINQLILLFIPTLHSQIHLNLSLEEVGVNAVAIKVCIHIQDIQREKN